MKLIVFVPCT